MPRFAQRQEPPPTDHLPPDDVLCDGLLVEGIDAGAAHRARIRALNAARQAAEQDSSAPRPRRAEDAGVP
jgi:hypothetical protein